MVYWYIWLRLLIVCPPSSVMCGALLLFNYIDGKDLKKKAFDIQCVLKLMSEKR